MVVQCRGRRFVCSRTESPLTKKALAVVCVGVRLSLNRRGPHKRSTRHTGRYRTNPQICYK